MRLVILGAGGHAAPVIEAIQAMGGFGILGLLDDAPRAGDVLGHPVLGPLARLGELGAQAAVVAIGDNAARLRLGALCRAAGLALPPILHPAALLSAHARIGEGAQVMARAVVGPRAALGPLALLNTGAILEHDAVAEEGAHLAPGSIACGGARIGAAAMLGAGAVLCPGVALGAGALAAAGAAVAAAVPPGMRVGGVPARPLPPAT